MNRARAPHLDWHRGSYPTLRGVVVLGLCAGGVPLLLASCATGPGVPCPGECVDEVVFELRPPAEGEQFEVLMRQGTVERSCVYDASGLSQLCMGGGVMRPEIVAQQLRTMVWHPVSEEEIELSVLVDGEPYAAVSATPSVKPEDAGCGSLCFEEQTIVVEP